MPSLHRTLKSGRGGCSWLHHRLLGVMCRLRTPKHYCVTVAVGSTPLPFMSDIPPIRHATTAAIYRRIDSVDAVDGGGRSRL
jgi:hypothetical protein